MEFPESILEFDSQQIHSSQMKQFVEVNNKISLSHSLYRQTDST